jgi:hypothetical protein
MIQNVTTDQHIPRIVIAVAAGVGAALIANTWMRSGLYAAAVGLLASVATGYCPLTAALAGGNEGAEPSVVVGPAQSSGLGTRGGHEFMRRDGHHGDAKPLQVQ